MRQLLIIFFILILSIQNLLASDVAAVGGLGVRAEEEQNASGYDGQGLLIIGFESVFQKDLKLLGEFSFFSSTTADSSLTVDRNHYELMAWLGYQAFLIDEVTSVWLEAGTGFFWESIETGVVSQTQSNTGDLELLLGVGADLRYQLTDQLFLSGGLRFLINTNNSLEPVFDLLVKMGYKF